MAERMIRANGVELCTESFGDPAHPAILLVAGLGSSMLWWDEQFCRMLADGDRFVIRYDHRDTGRSHTCQPGVPITTGTTSSTTPCESWMPTTCWPHTWSACRPEEGSRSCWRSTSRPRPVARAHQHLTRDTG